MGSTPKTLAHLLEDPSIQADFKELSSSKLDTSFNSENTLSNYFHTSMAPSNPNPLDNYPSVKLLLETYDDFLNNQRPYEFIDKVTECDPNLDPQHLFNQIDALCCSEKNIINILFDSFRVTPQPLIFAELLKGACLMRKDSGELCEELAGIDNVKPLQNDRYIFKGKFFPHLIFGKRCWKGQIYTCVYLRKKPTQYNKLPRFKRTMHRMFKWALGKWRVMGPYGNSPYTIKNPLVVPSN